MNNPVKDTIKRLKQFRSNKDKVVLDAIKKNEERIIDFNIAQLEVGTNEEGKEIRPKYSPKTVRVKRRRGQRFDRVTLFDEGGFHWGFHIKYGKKYFTITSDDWKTKKLVKKYGKNIFGLQREGWDHLEKFIIGDIKKYIDKNVI